jgi:hypothetical protein
MNHSGPILVYKFRADAAYYRTIIDRYYGQRRFLFRLPVQYGIVSLVIVGIFLWSTGSFSRTAVGLAVIVAFILMAGLVALTKISILYRFKRRADFGGEAVVTISKNGIGSSGRHAQGKWGWQAYPRAVRYPDGILLLRRGVIRWLPDAALQKGNPADATALVKSKTALREITKGV